MVIGLGNAQVAGHMLRVQSISALVSTDFSRLSEALRLTVNSEGYVFEVCPDAHKNTKVLSDFLADVGDARAQVRSEEVNLSLEL